MSTPPGASRPERETGRRCHELESVGTNAHGCREAETTPEAQAVLYTQLRTATFQAPQAILFPRLRLLTYLTCGRQRDPSSSRGRGCANWELQWPMPAQS